MAAAAGIIALCNQIFPGSEILFSVFAADLLCAGAAGFVKFHAVCVQNIILRIPVGCGSALLAVPTDTAQGIRIRIFGYLEGDGLPVAGADDIALQIGSEGGHIRISQTAQNRFCWVTVGIALTYGNDRIFRCYLPQPIVAGGRSRAVMAHQIGRASCRERV